VVGIVGWDVDVLGQVGLHGDECGVEVIFDLFGGEVFDLVFGDEVYV